MMNKTKNKVFLACSPFKKMSNKKAMSGIVAAVIMIALVIAIGGIVWLVVTNLITEELDEAGTCLDTLGKVTINSQYTCYNSSNGELLFSIGIGDINLEKVVVIVSGEGKTNSYEITNEFSNVDDNLKAYNGSDNVKLANKNEGLTYRLNASAEELGRPDSMKVYPVIKGRQCDASDTISRIGGCGLLED